MLRFYSRCVEWPLPVSDLQKIIDANVEVSRAVFLRHVDPREMLRQEQECGYERDPRRGLTMKKDYHVSYHRSTLHGSPVYYFRWSAIEYVFWNGPLCKVCGKTSPRKVMGVIPEECWDCWRKTIPKGQQIIRVLNA